MSQRCQFWNWECCDGPQEVERGPPPRGQPRPDQRPVERTDPEGRSYQAFTQDLDQTLICAVPQRTARIP